MGTMKALALGAALAGPVAGLVPGPAAAQEGTLGSALATLQRLAVQYAVLMTRSFVDLTYETIAVEPGTSDLVVTGLRLYPELDWDAGRRCAIAIDRIVIADANSFEVLRSTIGLSGVAIRPACLQPDTAGMLAELGYDGLAIESAAIDVAYHLPGSSAELDVQAALAEAAEIGLTAHFDYLWFRMPAAADADPMTAEVAPVPIARLGWAELVVENHGLWQALEPMLAEQIGDPNAIPDILRMVLGELLTEGGTRTATAEETAFVENLADEIARFVENRDRIVLTVAPEGGVLLTEELARAPDALIAALGPTVSSTPRAQREMIAPAELAAALAGDEGLDEAARLRVAEALVTGVGAPRSVETASRLLAPLAEVWNARAALLAARAGQRAGDAQAAYAMALRAMAGGERAAIPIADELEAALPLVAVLSAQGESAAGWPGAGADAAEGDGLVAASDLAGMRRRARAAADGRGRPRDYAEAYYWASLAAAAGDRGAASQRDRLDARFAGEEGWHEAAAAAAARALETWTAGGLAATIAARAR